MNNNRHVSSITSVEEEYIPSNSEKLSTPPASYFRNYNEFYIYKKMKEYEGD